MLVCPSCSRPNPGDAVFCYNDGMRLNGAAAAVAPGRFAAPLVFPSGRPCWSFDELAMACQDDWGGALEMLQSGALEAFLGGMGRGDLAGLAREAARFPDPSRGLDQLIAELPTQAVASAQLAISPLEIDLGRLRLGVDVRQELHLVNRGKGLLHGSVSSDVPWLGVGEFEGAGARHFQCLDRTTLAVQVRGKALRADVRPLVGRLTIESSGGNQTVLVRAEVPPVAFPQGVLAGARSPRQLAEKAREQPREAARLFESGAVKRWYESNGWSYPVDGDTVSGLAAVQQFFDALGLSKPARLELSQHALRLEGRPGQTVSAALRLSTQEKRPVYARAVSDQPWLTVVGVELEGSAAHIRVAVPAVPNQPGQQLDATLTIVGNGRQKFVVNVRLNVLAGSRPPAGPAGLPEWVTGGAASASPPTSWSPAEVTAPWAPAKLTAPWPVPPPELLTPDPVPPTLLPAPPRRRRSIVLWLVLVPLLLLLFAGAGALAVALALPLLRPPAPPKRNDKKADHNGQGAPALVEMDSRHVEVVFLLDTTGSMGGLLDGARAKIWAICNHIAGGKPTPDLKVGLIAYRDKNDAYVTQVTDLTHDLDAVYDVLQGLKADGGGDTPEHVNQALYEAVDKIGWSKDSKRTLKIIFLVGDAPPHMDYRDDVKYPVTCQKALKGGILVNTIQCGDDRDCETHWREIARLGGGRYERIPQQGGVVATPTPFDDKLIELGGRLFATALIYGDATQKARGEQMLKTARGLRGPIGADRAAYAAKSRRISPYDLLDAIAARRIQLEDVGDGQLPDRMTGLASAAKRRDFLDGVAREREALRKQMLELERQRAAVIHKATAGRGADAFDVRVIELLREQARKYDIEY